MKRYCFFVLMMSITSLAVAYQDGDIISQKPYVPEAYTTMSRDYKKHITEDIYAAYLEKYAAFNEVTCFDLRYMSDGIPVRAFLLHPPLADDVTYPVIIYNRGGYRESGKIDLLTICNDLYTLAQAGYVVVASQYRGSDDALGADELGGADVHDVLNLMSLAQNMAYVQKNNFFMLGFSRGGIMTYRCLKYGSVVNAAAVIAGITDLFLFEQMRPDIGRGMNFFIRLLRLSKQEAFRERSALFWPDQIDTPLLLMHNLEDAVVSIEQSKRFAQVLASRNKPHLFITYPAATHHLNNTFREDAYGNIIAWFKKHQR
jgi:dipeptidyl aminopeptidase/acylaminoacyl peptidase